MRSGKRNMVSIRSRFQMKFIKRKPLEYVAHAPWGGMVLFVAVTGQNREGGLCVFQ